ncbi:hypothetical protein SAMN06297422_106110 [Lachnospiraceae bacterium]|nr:hypothetical protein SAMN06297422_106110 [Lachnospiraceae bacterium]
MQLKLAKKNNLIINSLIFFFLIVSVASFFVGNNHIELIIVTLGLILVIYCARLSYFSIFSFILWFSFVQEYFASIDRSFASGRLKYDLNVPIYHKELFVCIAFFYFFEVILFSYTLVLQNEKLLYSKSVTMSKAVACIYVVLSMALIILAYPSLPSLNGVLLRDAGKISSSLFVPIALLMLSASYDYIRKNKILKLISIISLFWIVLHGDRVIVLGFCLYYAIRYLHENNNDNKKIDKIFNKKRFIVIICAVLLLILMIRVQTTRMGGYYQFGFKTLISSLIKQGTAADIVHAFNCSVDMWKRGNTLNGYTYLYYISNLLPSADQNLNPAKILMNNYNTLGGGLFFAEPMLNGGIALCFVHSAVFLMLVSWIFNKNSKYRVILMIPLYLLIFRFAWYASIAGLVKMICYYVPLVYFGTRIKVSKKNTFISDSISINE